MFLSSSHAHPIPGVGASFPPALPAGCNAPSPAETQVSFLHKLDQTPSDRTKPASASPHWLCCPLTRIKRAGGCLQRKNRRICLYYIIQRLSAAAFIQSFVIKKPISFTGTSSTGNVLAQEVGDRWGWNELLIISKGEMWGRANSPSKALAKPLGT